ncbi:hypothetical protein ABIB15_002525 [Marisediminicola sp. UYEF4]
MNIFARENAGENPSTPPETLAWLATIENDFGLLGRVLANPSTPSDTLPLFIGSTDSFHKQCGSVGGSGLVELHDRAAERTVSQVPLDRPVSLHR